jgi:hypothetical protein
MELLVRIVDKQSPLHYTIEKLNLLFTRGDVIDYHLDGKPWGRKEIGDPERVIIRTKISEAEAIALVAPEVPDNKNVATLRRRGMALNLDKLGIYSRPHDVIIAVDAQDLRAARFVKQRLPDFNAVARVRGV